MFNIEFLSETPQRNEYGHPELLGRITCGDESDLFLAPLSLWNREDYERQWREGAQRLLDGAECSAIVTGAILFWRPMWRVAESVRVREELLLPERLQVLGPGYDFKHAPYQLIQEYASTTPAGEVVSEWRTTLADIAQYLQRS